MVAILDISIFLMFPLVIIAYQPECHYIYYSRAAELCLKLMEMGGIHIFFKLNMFQGNCLPGNRQK